MPQDTSGNWAADVPTTGSNIKVIRREQKMSRGQFVMMLAERMFPRLMDFFRDKRDPAGLLFQPAHVRGMALNIAENLVRNREMRDQNDNA